MNDTKLGLKKKGRPLETKNHSKPNTLHPDTSILTKIIHLIGFNLQGIEEYTLPETRQVCYAAQISKETTIGTAMIYLKKGQMNR